ncbi:ABC transporter permease [Methanoregula sp.]|uniref:ABC transporter permease n=1 Tax=Methanoregula sp. TaxID=2052170 RepID=UPI002D0A74B1|nr:ABC transporter permease [Methanoregula sp.]HVP96303.1 ABC transporter permease [Methanoregula sp.]
MKARHVTVVAKKEFFGLASEKTILLAVLLQVFIALFSSFLMVGLTSMYDPAALSGYSHFRYDIAYAGNETPLLGYLEEGSDLRVHQMDLSTAVELLKERRISAVIYVPDTPAVSDDPVKITLYTLANDLQGAVVDVRLKSVFLQYEQNLRTARAGRLDVTPIPLQVPASAGSGDFYGFVYGLLVPLLVFLPGILSAALIIDLITEEYQHGTLETLISTPVTFAEMVWGKVLICTLLVPIQAGAWILLLSLNRIAIEDPFLILLHVTLGSLVLILLGAFCALHYKERTAAQFVFSTALVVILLFVLALPYNPLNLVARIAVGTAGTEQWLLLAVTTLAVIGLGYAMQAYAGRIERAPSGK